VVVEECQEQSGFLFAHACGHPVAAVCTRCQKAVCEQHTVRGSEGMPLCTTCARQSRDDDGPDSSDLSDDSPYFYSWYHFRRHGFDETEGPDPHDFTEGDQGVLDAPGEEGADEDDPFEDDMGAS
jgi:hypothetical protein